MNFIQNILSAQNHLSLNKKIEDEKKLLHKAKDIFIGLKTDRNSVLFSVEKIDCRLLKKNKLRYAKDSFLLKFSYLVDNKLNNEKKVPARVDYIGKGEIDRSTLYSFDGSFL